MNEVQLVGPLPDVTITAPSGLAYIVGGDSRVLVRESDVSFMAQFGYVPVGAPPVVPTEALAPVTVIEESNDAEGGFSV